ncbi:MAG: hypothetical protein HQQ73_06470 [Desulfobulbaceae bacterium]|jgi:hypothetical protein|nr:hypothetical protein [Desulfobulbaceae bacterium]
MDTCQLLLLGFTVLSTNLLAALSYISLHPTMRIEESPHYFADGSRIA